MMAPPDRIAPEDPFAALVEEAYLAFARPRPAAIGVCQGCCMDPQIEADFFNPDIRDLPLHYVQDWYSAAYERGGVPKPTWAYLLPRILEILASGQTLDHVGLETSLNRFDTGNPDHWSEQQWRVLDRFQRMFLRRGIENGGERLDDLLCMFRLGGWGLADLLDQVAAVGDAVLAECLWRDWCEGCAPGRESVWITAFWDTPDNSTVFDFYTSSALRNRMEALALGDRVDPQLAAKACAVVDVIEAERRC